MAPELGILLKCNCRCDSVETTSSDVRARLSPKAAAWAQPERAHGLSGGQAEPKPSERARLGSAWAWATAFEGEFTKVAYIQCKHDGTTRIPRKKSFSIDRIYCNK